MSYRSLRDFIARLESDGELVRVSEPVSTVLEMTEIQTRLLAEGGPAVLFENAAEGRRHAVGHAGAGQPVRHGRARRLGVTMGGTERRDARACARSARLLALLRQPEPPRSSREAIELLPLAKTALAMKPKTVGGLLGARPARRSCCEGDDIDLAPAGPDLLAGRAGAADHLAAGRDQGARRSARGQLQPRHLPHAGDWAQTPDADALAQASRRRPAPRALGKAERPSRCPAAVGDRRRSRHHPGRRDAGARHPVGIPVRRAAARPTRRAGRLRARCRSRCRPRPRSCSRARSRSTTIGDEGPYGDHTGYYNSVERFPVFTVTAITMRRDPIYLSTFTGRPPDEPSRARRGAERSVHSAVEAAVPRDRRFLAAAGRLLLPHRRRQHEEGLSRPRQARDDGRVVLSAPVHVHQVGDRRGRRHRRARLEGRDVGDLHPHGSGARHHGHREHARSTISTSPRPNPASAPRSASTPPTSCRPRPSANGAARSAWTRRDPHSDREMVTAGPSRNRKVDLGIECSLYS